MASMAEKDVYLTIKRREDETTRKVLHAFPADKMEFRVSPDGQTAGKIAWTLALGNMVVDHILKDGITPTGSMPEMPTTWPDLLAAFDRGCDEATRKVGAMQDGEMDVMVTMPVGPKKMGEMRRGEALWYFLHDGIHHRGQLSVYLRAVGAHVPSIYGPSGDEPWF